VTPDITGKVLGISDKSYYLLDNLKTTSVPLLLLDILIVATFFYLIYIFLYETRALRILYGLFVILILLTVGQLFNLVLLNWILKYVGAVLVVAIPVVFQPELRGALEKLGRAEFIGDHSFQKEHKNAVVDAVTRAVYSLSSSKIGGLIILQRKTGLREYAENGNRINAEVTADMLLSIFYPKSPLHDGAVIIADAKIVAARVVLPVTETRISGNLGTRHRAAIGITENSDALAIVVSEDSGIVSIALNGKLERRISEDKLRAKLNRLLKVSTSRDD